MYNIDDLHESGKMPTRYYNQMNGKSAQENYNKLLRKRAKKNESFILAMIQNSLSAVVKTALDQIFKELKL